MDYEDVSSMGEHPVVPTLGEWVVEQHDWHYEKSVKFARGTPLNAYHSGWVDALAAVNRRIVS